ncbi:putative glucan endo-1,3-beta-D-glucosidase [Helianthus annuus]|uniref:glucan endo-1,3-beta-D-glucosidase n=1 Tax=Helianthus annuus TaxID=4232 RepID=A0A251VQ68_HELAN|nr:glucan endo-1,3-beta-glucosidase 4 [Helianthus annuus]KAF5822917.1 putative glucan endo-1,3-beta-D-glucosidase [Helianthus annuus]KAJ0627686.1 putative glucan endo-1,3-beta-D-glucosidase [Helianthus annuus]KAJ0783985.1 putative glucan endo-1,3-beta-D-glucosidase [Helianthus annuus]KAJ0948931.1 putative glucan endo-1,3-beta-D-glucosidase [Helianthus annuus]
MHWMFETMRLELWLGSMLVIFASLSNAIDPFVGINIGTNQSNLPSPEQIVGTLRTHHITHVRLFDTNARLLTALSDTGIEVMISVTNDEVSEIGESPSFAATWVNTHVAAFKPATNITAIAVGSEFVSSNPIAAATVLVPAMENLYNALVASNLNDQIKVSTPLSMDMIPKPFPPSTATFNASLNSTIHRILDFLKNSNSFYMLNAFPYDTYVQSNGVFPIQYALFQPLPVVKQIVDPNTLFHYESMFDAMVDATYYSIFAYNSSVIPIIVTETGWPWSGEANESDATVESADTFNNNLIQRVLTGSGPPSQPTLLLKSYIYEMFNDDKKPSYGVFFRNGSSVYDLDLGGPTGNLSGGFCVARKGVDPTSLQGGLNWACGPGQANCTAIQSGQPCYLPNTVQNHASYAYNDYYQRKRTVGGTCDFGGTAVITNVNPSYGSCIYTGSSNSSAGGVSPPAFVPAGPSGSLSPPHRVPKTGYLILATVLTCWLLDV